MRILASILGILFTVTLAAAVPVVQESNGIHFFPDGIEVGPGASIVGPISGPVTDAGGQVFNVTASPWLATGDGTTDDTAALRSVIADIPAEGGIMYFPKGSAGTYIVAPSGLGPMLSLKAHMKVQCAPGVTIKIADSSLVGGIPGRVFANQDSSGVAIDGSDTEITGCIFDGNARNNPAASSPFEPEIIECQDCVGVRVNHNRALDVTARWITLYRGAELHVDYNDLYMVGEEQNADPIQVNGANGITISHNVVGNTGEGIVFEHATGTSPAAGAGEATNGTIDDNLIIAYAANEICQDNGIPFACCTAYQTGDSAGFCAAGNPQGGALIILASNTTVSNNVIRGHNSINIEGGRGFDTKNVSFVNNQVLDGTANGYGILVITGSHPNADQPVHDITITGGRTVSPNAACVAIYSAAINAPYNITIKDLDCLTPNGDGILFQGGGTGGSTTSASSQHDINITNVRIQDTCVGGGTCGGIRFDNNGGSPDFTDITVQDSDIIGSARYGIWMEAGQTRFNVLRNTFRDNTNGSTNWASGSITNWINNVNTDSQLAPAGTTPTFGTVIDNNGSVFANIDTAGSGVSPNYWKSISNGSRVYCTDCAQSELCAGSSTGATVRKIDSLNHCSAATTCGSSLFTPIGITGVDAHATSSVTVPATPGELICSKFSPTCNMKATKMSFRLATGTNTTKGCAMAVYDNAGTTKILDTGVIAGAVCDTAGPGANVNITGLTAGQLWAGQNYWACIAFEASATMQYTGLQSGNFFTLYNQIEVHGTNGTNVASFPGGMPSSIGTLTAATPQVPIMAIGF